MAIPASEWSDGNAPNPLSLEHGTTAQKRCTAYGPTQTRSQLAYGSYLRAMLYCPLRASEMANMRCSNVELDHKRLVLSALETMNGDPFFMHYQTQQSHFFKAV